MNNEMLKQLKKMQSQMEQKQKELDAKVFKVEKQGIVLEMKGDFTLVSVNVDSILIDPEDKEILEDLIIVAMNELIDLIKEETEKITPQMPGGMPF
ncbi:MULTISPECIES: YbaB/EbfC family nucleoid-associated protein [unclassified Mycoplasma]|uniref:YbaB/EbfC family nucleoid-associated protein n=1 Tax=unclassified Mycoplasma TaxID=2683645 RepID=UPI00211C4DB6|nr:MULTISPECIES: YbaB/EbfC family nucleoid-associated protein [unclassified Mycoplasma]UUM19718.1 YbaB/EbfC family nucleoid-associated protein [Mycoplasma sp. 1578d]UUM24701.1 YbaB/EbfC family nucleoid-associated protein [Mycoplasma sp. 3686d]